MRFCIEGVHLMVYLIPPSHMAGAADVEVFVEELFTSVTMHVNIGQLF